MNDEEDVTPASDSATIQRAEGRKFAEFTLWGFRALEAALVLTCLALVFFQRLIELEQIEIGGDALTVWEFARTLVSGGDFPKHLNHHTSRFGLVLPAMIAQWGFGSAATAYFVAPLGASVLLHLLVYLIGRKLSGPVAGAISVVALLQFEPMVRGSSQLLPETFGPMYAAFATYAALLYSDARTMAGRWATLCLTGLGLIFAYGAKLVFLFYAPGIALLLWFGGSQGPLLPEAWTAGSVPDGDASAVRLWLHRLKASPFLVPGALTLLVLLLILLETVVLKGVAGEGSRFSVVQSSHGGGGPKGPRIQAAADFFALYTRAPTEWHQALTAGLLAWLGVSAFARDRRAKLVGLSLLIFFVLQTFIVRSFDPLTPWFQPHPRYLLGMVGPIFIMIGVFVGEAARKWTSGDADPSPRGRAVALVSALFLFAIAGRDLPARFDAEWGKRDALTRTRRVAEDLTKAYAAGIPIVSDSPGGKPAIAAASVFIHPDVLRMGDGRPVVTGKVIQKTSKNGKFVARAALVKGIKRDRLRNVVEERARARRCAVVLRQSVRFLVGNTGYGKNCISLEDEFSQNPRAGMADENQRSRKPARRRAPARRPKTARP